MASRITHQVRRSARLSWLIALATVLGAGALVLAPRPVQGPGWVEIARLGAARAAVEERPGEVVRAPVQVRLTGGGGGEGPVEIRF